MSVESYAHKAAKNVVVSWLREASDIPEDRWVSTMGCHWRPNRGAPHFGIWDEYPILADQTGICPVWDEWAAADDEISPFTEAPPTYDYLKGIGRRPKAVLDIAIQHKGLIQTGIEIVHKNPPTHEKLIFLHQVHLCSLLVIPAAWILGQIQTPAHVPSEFWKWGAPRQIGGR